MNANLIAPEVIQRFAGSLLHFHLARCRYRADSCSRSPHVASSIRGSALRIRNRSAHLHAGGSAASPSRSIRRPAP
jgi:hypothetical protein